MQAVTSKPDRPLRRQVAIITTMVGCLLCGCQTPSGLRKIPATELPASYRASKLSQPVIDLSRLKQVALNSKIIYPSDKLDVLVISGAETAPITATPMRVNERGELDLKDIGPVHVAGLEFREAEEKIKRASIARGIFRNASITISLNERQSHSVVVAGAVTNPGVHKIPRGDSDVLAAITAAGGLSEKAGTTIKIRHPKPIGNGSGVQQASLQDPPSAESQIALATHVTAADVLSGKTGNLSLQDGSVVIVEEHIPDRIYVQGLVKKAGEFDLPRNRPLRVDQAVALAEGRTLEFADTVHITRTIEGAEPVLITVSLKEAKTNRDANIVLMPNDVVSVEETPTTFAVDFMRNFFRIGFSSAIPGF